MNQTPRATVWLALRDFGPLTPAGLSVRLGFDIHDVRKHLVELHVCRFIESIRAPDPLSGDSVTMAQVTSMPYSDAYAERALDRYAAQQRDREAETAEREFHSTSPPDSIAQSADPASGVRCEGQQRFIVEYLAQRGDATREEIAAGTGIAISSVNPRVRELLDAHIIRETPRTRKTDAGRAAQVLELTSQPLLF